MAKVRLSEDLPDVLKGEMPLLYYPLLEETQERVIEDEG